MHADVSVSSRAMSLVTFACSICKFRSCYGDDMVEHLKSKFHREHFRYLASQMTKPTSDFLQVSLFFIMIPADAFVYLFSYEQSC